MKLVTRSFVLVQFVVACCFFLYFCPKTWAQAAATSTALPAAKPTASPPVQAIPVPQQAAPDSSPNPNALLLQFQSALSADAKAYHEFLSTEDTAYRVFVKDSLDQLRGWGVMLGTIAVGFFSILGTIAVGIVSFLGYRNEKQIRTEVKSRFATTIQRIVEDEFLRITNEVRSEQDKKFESMRQEQNEKFEQQLAVIKEDVYALLAAVPGAKPVPHLPPAGATSVLSDSGRQDALRRMKEALHDEKFRWRSIPRLATIGGVSEAQALEILRSDSDVIFSHVIFGEGEGGQLARLKSR